MMYVLLEAILKLCRYHRIYIYINERERERVREREKLYMHVTAKKMCHQQLSDDFGLVLGLSNNTNKPE